MSKERSFFGKDFGVRVGAVIERNGSLLLVRHQKPREDTYWVLPGGRLEPGETIPECATREVFEETGLEGRFSGVLYISEFLKPDRHTVDVTARVEVDLGAEPALGDDPEVEPGSEPTLREIRWVALDDLREIGLLPSWIRDRLAADARVDWLGHDPYVEGEKG